MKKIIFLLVITMVVQAEARFTSADKARAVSTATTQATTISTNAQSGSTTTTSTANTLEQSSVNTLNNSQKGQTTAIVTEVAMYGMGAYYATQCPPTNYAACAMAAVMFYMGSQAGKSASSYNGPIGDAGTDICTYSTTSCASTQTNPYTATLTPGTISQAKMDAEAAQITEGLNKAGYSVDLGSGNITGPNGTSMNANDPSSLASALGANAASKLQNDINSMAADAKAKVDALGNKNASLMAELGGAGGGAAITPGAGFDNEDANGGKGVNGLAGLAAKNALTRKPAQMSGLSKNFNGEPIGVAADSIFEMMSRRYQLKNNQKTFLGSSGL
jgi:hypothetical protein